ncbi:MAG TPA: nucleotidyltransferase domain-containing protein [archaeon]|nr:nucleotidyltransferase domain-containing protein [archaeon]
MEKNTKNEMNKIVSELKRSKKVEAILLFGSHAKGTDKKLSDVDIAVVSKNPDKSIESEVSSCSSKIFDVVNFHRLPVYIQFEALKYGKLLFVKDKKNLLETRKAVLSEYLEMSDFYEKLSRRISAS